MTLYYIASLKHTRSTDEHIIWWAAYRQGYTATVGNYIGAYCYGEACELNDGIDHIAVPATAVWNLLSPEPKVFSVGKPVRMYDTRGPAVENSFVNWLELLSARLPNKDSHKVIINPFTGKSKVVG